MMSNIRKMCEKYPQYRDKILNAFNAVINDKERDFEAELYGCDIHEKDMHLMVMDVIEFLFGGKK